MRGGRPDPAGLPHRRRADLEKHGGSVDTVAMDSPPKDSKPQGRRSWSWWYLLFLVQFAVALWPPFYNKIEPRFFGMPFFYWFQLLWVFVCALLTAVVYLATDA
jgi:hypothetical protein